MSEFETTRKNLVTARAETHALSRQVFRLRQRLARWRRQRRQQERSANRSPTTVDPRLAELDRRISSLRDEIDALRGQLQVAEKAELGHLGRFAAFTDPREQIEQFSARLPILLMPLRIETRFKRAAELGGDATPGRNPTGSGTPVSEIGPERFAAPPDGGELWVRAYPDDVMVDVFEDTLSEDEVRRARSYWADLWRAGGAEAAERAAWRSLLAGQGSGRSYWVIENHRPLNEDERPTPADGVPTVILTINAQPPLTEPEKSTVSTFWAAFWQAADDPTAQADAVATLVAALGAERAETIQRDYVPSHLTDPPPAGSTRDETSVVVAHLAFPDDDTMAARESGWTQAPHAKTLPDRLVLIGYRGGEKVLEQIGRPIPSPLVVAPDPSAEEGDQLRPDGDELIVGSAMEWVVDFDRALEVGMAFRVPLSAIEFRSGFDTLMVLGVRSRSDAEDGRRELEELIEHHHASKAGFSILPQGRPTNNVEGEGAAYSWQEDSDTSFDQYFASASSDPSADDPTSWEEKRDGRWLAELLGLDPAKLAAIPFYQRTDLCDARAMNTALWPATLGYFLTHMLDPILDDDAVERSRDFFTRHVVARGPLPAIRVGKQPYGILPATPRSRIEWLGRRPLAGVADSTVSRDPESAFLRRIYGLLRKIEADFDPLMEKVAHLGKPGSDRHQLLLDVLGLHPGSVEFQQRWAESFAQLYNRMAMQGSGGALLAAIIALGYVQSGLDLLGDLGYQAEEGADHPDILSKLFLRKANQLKGGLIDDRPLSEIDPIRPYTESGENYIRWLIDAASTSHDALRLQKGFAERPPNALLYLMLHHGLDLSFVETSVRLFFEAALIDQSQLTAFRREPRFIGVQEASLADPLQAGGSRWQYLYRRDPQITGDPQRTVGELIPTVLQTRRATAYLKRQLDALEHLESRPTAVLERAFAEHLDLCTYRFDAWYGGLLSHQLETLRYTREVDTPNDSPAAVDDPEPVRGLYLGAYGWLENVRPEHQRLEPVDLPAELAETFDPTADPPLVRDSQNQGYIHAPSLNHAVTAAVLRNGYLSNATPDNPGSLAINLSSERVRGALAIIEGMKNQQSLGALLGYRFERALHDRHDVEVDALIFELRKAFPLVGDRLKPTRTGRQDAFGRRLHIRRVEARHVIDGLALVEHIAETGQKTYPFGLDDALDPADAEQIAAVSEEAERLADLADAVADLAMAESVHQVVQGNYDRAGAVLDTYSKGKFPSTPDVIKTPRSGVTLTHRTALHLEVGLDPSDAALVSPRARAEPAINAWLASLLPPSGQVACRVTITDPLDQSTTDHVVTQADLDLLPIDLLYLLDPDDERSARALDDRIEAHVLAAVAPRPHAELQIAYRDRIPAIPGHVPFFELMALVRSLRTLLLRSRPLRANDMALSGEASRAAENEPALDPRRVSLPRDQLAGHVGGLETFRATLQARLDAEEHEQIRTEIDSTLATFTQLMLALGPYADLDTGTGVIFADRRRIFTELLATLQATIVRWNGRLDAFDQAITAYDAATGAADEQKFLALQKAERLISTTRTDPLPAQPDDLRDDLANLRRAAFVAQRDQLVTLHASATTLGGLHDAIVAAGPTLAGFDPQPIDLAGPARQMVVLAEDMAHRASELTSQLGARLAVIDGHLADASTAVAGKESVEALTAAAKECFGEDFQIVPEFLLPTDQAEEWAMAWGPGASADRTVLDYLVNDLGRRFPVDDWLTGIARVRPKMHAFESTAHLAEAMNGRELVLEPVQFPHRPDVPWLGLDFPATTASGDPFRIDEDKLLYTAHWVQGFDKSRRQAGLLLDEWTEVLPTRTEDTGVAFHYDRPNSEAPQTLLLALAPRLGGQWRWADLVDTVLETMDLAKKRAIEPDHIDTTAYARLLPALVSAVTMHPITASLNLSFNNNLAEVLAEADS